MKVLIAGSRTIHDKQYVFACINSLNLDITEIVSGGAPGVDALGEEYARANNIPIRQFFPDWIKHGKKAGVLRNKEMVKYADFVIVIWDGCSKGALSTIREAIHHGKQLEVF